MSGAVGREDGGAGKIKFNLKLSESDYAIVGALADRMDGAMADAVREAVRMLWWLANEYEDGNRLMIWRGDQLTELLIPSLERSVLDGLPAPDRMLGQFHREDKAAPRGRRQSTAPGERPVS